MSKRSLLAIDLILAFVFLAGMILFYKMESDFWISCLFLIVLGAAAIARVVVAFLISRNR